MSRRTNVPSKTDKTPTTSGKRQTRDSGSNSNRASASASGHRHQTHQQTVLKLNKSSKPLDTDTQTLTFFEPPKLSEESRNGKGQGSILSNFASSLTGLIKGREPDTAQIKGKKPSDTATRTRNGGAGGGSAKSGDEYSAARKLQDIQDKYAATAAPLKSSPPDGPHKETKSPRESHPIRVPTSYSSSSGAGGHYTELTERFVKAKNDANLEALWNMFKGEQVLKDKRIICFRADERPYNFEARVINKARETYCYLTDAALDSTNEEIHAAIKESIATGHGLTDVEAILNLEQDIRRFIAKNEEYVAKNRILFQNLASASK